MISKCFLWLIIPCFIINASISRSKSFLHIKSGSAYGENCSLENGSFPSLLDFILEEYLDLVEDLPKTDKPKTNLAHKLKASYSQVALKKETFLFTGVANVIQHVPKLYRPQNFFLSDYYNFLFRLTPF